LLCLKLKIKKRSLFWRSVISVKKTITSSIKGDRLCVKGGQIYFSLALLEGLM
jgi:hypothetical protein